MYMFLMISLPPLFLFWTFVCNGQRHTQNPINHVRWSVLKKKSATKSREPFSQNAPP